MLHSRCPVSATPTHMLRICVNPRLAFICGRADNACTNLLGFLVRYVRTRGIVEIAESGKTADFRSVLCRTYSPRMARATNSCTPRWFGRRTARVLLADFWYFWSYKSTIKEKLLYDTSLSEFFSLVRKERKGQKEESIDSRLGDADTHASHMCQSLF